eukprot:g36467.t1
MNTDLASYTHILLTNGQNHIHRVITCASITREKLVQLVLVVLRVLRVQEESQEAPDPQALLELPVTLVLTVFLEPKVLLVLLALLVLPVSLVHVALQVHKALLALSVLKVN